MPAMGGGGMDFKHVAGLGGLVYKAFQEQCVEMSATPPCSNRSGSGGPVGA
jgi:hypothetical protein